jgi:hypothetical protein
MRFPRNPFITPLPRAGLNSRLPVLFSLNFFPNGDTVKLVVPRVFPVQYYVAKTIFIKS